MTRDSASEGGVIRPLMVGIAGAVAMMKPALVKKMDIAAKDKTRERKERRLDRAVRMSKLLVLNSLHYPTRTVALGIRPGEELYNRDLTSDGAKDCRTESLVRELNAWGERKQTLPLRKGLGILNACWSMAMNSRPEIQQRLSLKNRPRQVGHGGKFKRRGVTYVSRSTMTR